ncbi:uncharacterized protein LOC117328476 [Pecten maximus]|uniref:uncharacterized protein LOC117328476 n=1 Tax=Pecten maximus TaxID=6579 RepID=UPI001458D666|nr:uncharacterized protein LOC117328476 [Pecten maximus]
MCSGDAIHHIYLSNSEDSVEELPSQEVIYSRQAYGQTPTATRDIETATKPNGDDESPPPSTSFSVTEDKKRKKKTSRKKKKEKGRNYKSTDEQTERAFPALQEVGRNVKPTDEQTEREFPALQEVVRNYTPTDEQTERESTAIREVGRNFTPMDEQRDRESSALQEIERTRHTTATPIESEEVMYARNQRQSLHQQTEVSQNCTDESTRTKKRKRKRKSYADEEPLIYIFD